MNKPIFIAVLISMTSAISPANSQGVSFGISTPPNGGCQRAETTQWLGPVKISLNYSRPNVHGANGRDRKGHIWGELIAYGLEDLGGVGPSKTSLSPWRAGANENTIFTISHDVLIEGKLLKAGSYGLFLLLEKDKPWTWIFSNNSSTWGSWTYQPDEDALRVQVQPANSPYNEYLTYGFDDATYSTSTVVLVWEDKKIPFKIEVPNTDELYLSLIRNELRNYEGFTYQNFQAAAEFCAERKINLTEGLTWAENAIEYPFLGVEMYSTLATKAHVLRAMNRLDEAEKAMARAINLPSTKASQITAYGHYLLSKGKKKEALEVFKLNQSKHPNEAATFVGMGYWFENSGDKRAAIEAFEKALKLLPTSSDFKGLDGKRLEVYTGWRNRINKLKEGG